MYKITFGKRQSYKRWNNNNVSSTKCIGIASTVTIFVDGRPWGEIRRRPKERYWNIIPDSDTITMAKKTLSCNTTLTDAKFLVKEYFKNL